MTDELTHALLSVRSMMNSFRSWTDADVARFRALIDHAIANHAEELGRQRDELVGALEAFAKIEAEKGRNNVIGRLEQLERQRDELMAELEALLKFETVPVGAARAAAHDNARKLVAFFKIEGEKG